MVKYKDEFGKTFKKVRQNMKKSQVKMGELLVITGAAVGNWERGEDFPGFDLWQKIEAATGLKPGDYEDRPDQQATATNSSMSPVINTKEGKTVVTIGTVPQSSAVTLPLSDNEYELIKKFRKFGNQHIIEKWLKELAVIEAMSR